MRGVGREPRLIAHFRMPGFEKCDTVFHQRVDIQHMRIKRWLGCELGERADSALQRFNFVHHDRRRLSKKRPAAFGARLVMSRDHLLHSQPDGR